MKILFISMPSIHAIRWIENLKNTDFELYWFDVTNKGKLKVDFNLTQFIDWKKRKIPYLKGEYKFSKKFPNAYFKTKHLFEITENEAVEKVLRTVNPDIIHCMELHYCTFPILKTLKKFKNIPFIYSCWGSDFYNHLQIRKDVKKIKKVLERVDFLITDCHRDYKYALDFNFKGNFLGVLPGGGGYRIEDLRNNFIPVSNRKLILIKGYENQQARAINVLKAINLIINDLNNYEIIVFAQRQNVADYVKNYPSLNNKIKFIDEIPHSELLKLMGKALIYIGNSKSDGIANTLLEAMIMGAFPIQSNPGNVTMEVISNNENGLLINDEDNISGIKDLIVAALDDSFRLEDAAIKNYRIVSERCDYAFTQKIIQNLYVRVVNQSTYSI